MKIKWHYFILTIISISIISYILFTQQSESPIKIGVLMIGDIRYEKLIGLQEGMQELGYREQEIEYIIKNANQDERMLKENIHDLLVNEPSMIVTLGGIETEMLKEEMERLGKSIPVIFAGLAAPMELGIIKDYQHPGGLFTGIDNYHTSISGKRLELLQQLVPSIRTIHVLYDKEINVSKLSLENTLEAAEKLSLTIKVWNVSEVDFYDHFQQNIKENDAILLMPGFTIETITKDIAQYAKQHRIPTMGIYEHEVREDILATYGSSFYDQGFQSARFVSLIIQGNSPANIPVELPDHIRFIVNEKMKNEMAIELNEALLRMAEFVSLEEKESKPE